MPSFRIFLCTFATTLNNTVITANVRLLKRLDSYILKNFMLFFAASFFVSLFVLLMQFTWRYLEELISKGVDGEVLAQFFFYASLNLVPLALPLSLLLGSLLAFSSIGENLELLAMKAAGVSLIRIMRPLMVVVGVISIGSFFFQNNVFPVTTRELAALVWSMKQANPEMDIPEGRFYNISKYNIFVERKDMETGMLHNVTIYSLSGNYQDTEITLADSAMLQSTADKRNIKLTLFQGERFKNLGGQNGTMMKANVPYMRETFLHEEVIIPFDTNLDLMNSSAFSHNAQTKALRDIERGIDSLHHRIDSCGRQLYTSMLRNNMNRSITLPQADSAKLAASLSDKQSFDTTYVHLNNIQKGNVLKRMQSTVNQLQAEYEFRSLISNEDNRFLRIHMMEWNKKFTLSVACILFFFIGAPLGAIIRKGGIGIPVIVSVIIFIAYYLINNSGEKMARSGNIEVLFGVWVSSMIMAPFGVWLTQRANSDSVIFSADSYIRFFRRLLGLRESRKLNIKDVVINDPDYTTLPRRMQQLVTECQEYATRKHLLSIPSYPKLFFSFHKDTRISDISQELEALVEELHNSKDAAIITYINQLPVLSATAHTRPFATRRRNIIAGVLLPVGLVLYFRIWRYRLRLARDIKQIESIFNKIIRRINKQQYGASNKA